MEREEALQAARRVLLALGCAVDRAVIAHDADAEVRLTAAYEDALDVVAWLAGDHE